MIEIKTLEIAGMASVLQALRLPFGKECRSECQVNMSINEDYEPPMLQYGSNCFIDEKDLKLLSTLIKRGDEHSKSIRGFIVYAQIEAPIWFYRELETYKIGRERLSCESTMHIECKGLSGEELEKAKDEIPMGHIQKTVDWFSYQTLRRIWIQRHSHRLPMWHDFCAWIEGLPFANELILVGLNKDENE
jgi:hypothetical protein